jgi:hypothetical protein
MTPNKSEKDAAGRLRIALLDDGRVEFREGGFVITRRAVRVSRCSHGRGAFSVRR